MNTSSRGVKADYCSADARVLAPPVSRDSAPVTIGPSSRFTKERAGAA